MDVFSLHVTSGLLDVKQEVMAFRHSGNKRDVVHRVLLRCYLSIWQHGGSHFESPPLLRRWFLFPIPTACSGSGPSLVLLFLISFDTFSVRQRDAGWRVVLCSEAAANTACLWWDTVMTLPTGFSTPMRAKKQTRPTTLRWLIHQIDWSYISKFLLIGKQSFDTQTKEFMSNVLDWQARMSDEGHCRNGNVQWFNQAPV